MRKRLVYFLLSVCGLMAIAAGVHLYTLYQRWSGPDALLGRAARAVQKGQLSEAELLARSAIKVDPGNVNARLQAADILTAIAVEKGGQDSPAAVEQLLQAARLAPNDVEVQTRVYLALRRLGRSEAALEYARRAVELGSDKPQGLQLVADAELKAKNWEAADGLLTKLASVSKRGSLAVFLRRMQIPERPEQVGKQEAYCEEFLRDFATIPDLELRGLDPKLITVVVQTINRQIDLASAELLIPRAITGLTILDRILENGFFAEDQTPLVQLAQKLAARGEQCEVKSEKSLRRLQEAFAEFGRSLFAIDSPMAELSSGFVLQMSRSALMSNDPKFAISVLPHVVQQQQKKGQSFPLTDEERASAAAILLATGERLLQAGRQNSLLTASATLRKHKPTSSIAHLMIALSHAGAGKPEETNSFLTIAEKDSAIDPVLIRAIRCRSFQQARDWVSLAEKLRELQTLEVSDRQKNLLQILLGAGDRQRLIRTMALLQSGQIESADQELASLTESSLYGLGVLMRVLIELQRGTLQQAEDLLKQLQQTGAAGTEGVIAEIAVTAATGQSDRIETILTKQLDRTPNDDRIRLLLARWYLSLQRHDEALTLYQRVLGSNPASVHAWMMTALILQKNGRTSEITQLINQMRDTREVRAFAGQLQRQVREFGKQLQIARSRNDEAVQIVDLIPNDSSQVSADWYLMVNSLRATNRATPVRILEQFQVALQRQDDDPVDSKVLDRLGERLLLVVSSVPDSDRAELGDRVRKLVQQFPRDPAVRIAAIVHLARRNDFSAAWQHAQVLAKHDREPGRPEYWYARLLAGSFRIDEAARQIEASLRIADRPHVRLFAARIELFRHQPRRVLEHLDHLPPSMIRDPEPTLMRSEAFRAMGRKNNASALLVELLSRHPERVDVWFMLADSYERDHGGDQAIGIVKQALQKHPQNASVRARLLSLLVHHNRLSEATTLASQLAGPNPNPQMALWLASVFLGEKNGVQAGESWLKQAGDLKGSTFLQAMVLYRQGKAIGDLRRIQRARVQLEQLLQHEPQSLSLLNNLGWILAADLKRPDLALPYAERILALTGGRPTSPGLVDTVAEVLHANGRTVQALNLVRHAMLADPLDGVLRYHSGVLQLATLQDRSLIGPAIRDLELAHTRARLSPVRESVVASLRKQFAELTP